MPLPTGDAPADREVALPTGRWPGCSGAGIATSVTPPTDADEDAGPRCSTSRVSRRIDDARGVRVVGWSGEDASAGGAVGGQLGGGDHGKDVVLVQAGVSGTGHPLLKLGEQPVPVHRRHRTKVLLDERARPPGRGETGVFGLTAHSSTTIVAVGDRSPGRSVPIRMPLRTCCTSCR